MKQIIVLTAWLALACSCTDLTETSYSDILMRDYFTSKEAVLMNAGRAYTKLQRFPEEQRLWTLFETTSDELAIPIRDDGEWNGNGRYKELQEHRIDPSNKFLTNAWQYLFEGISACNEVLFETETSPSDFEGKGQIIAEIKILRALFYYWAMDGWGNIPFVTDYTDRSLPEQKDRKYVYAFIEKEILENRDKLQLMPTPEYYGRVTQGMANLLLAKLYINAKEWIGTERWQDAIDACDQIINSGAYQIEDNYFANFKIKNETSKENIFVIVYDALLTKDRFYWYTLTLNDASRATYNFEGNMWDGFVCQPDFFKTFSDADLRRNMFIFGQQYDKQGNPIVINGENFIYTPEIGSYNSRKKWEGARIGKYEYQENLQYSVNDMENDFVLFRYADVLYTKLEALWRKSGTVGSFLNDADVQKIRTRVGMVPFTEADITSANLLAELGHEFACEAHRRQDLIRFGEWGKAWWSKPASDSNKKLFPIPYTVLNANPNLVQNPR